MLSQLYTLVKLAKSHYLFLSFVCILYIVFVCLFKLFVCIFNFLLPLVENKDVQFFLQLETVPPAPVCQSHRRGRSLVRNLVMGGLKTIAKTKRGWLRLFASCIIRPNGPPPTSCIKHSRRYPSETFAPADYP